MPQRCISSIAAEMAVLVCARVVAGIARSTRPCALSTKTPAGFPCASRSTDPPAGSFVSLFTPAFCIAMALARPACPSTRSRYTGWSGTARVSASCVGKRVSPQSFWSQPRPITHSPLGVVRARSTTRAITCAYELVPVRSTLRSAAPSPATCACASVMPGITVRPARSSVRVALPINARAPASLPTNTTRPPRIAIACTTGRAPSAV